LGCTNKEIIFTSGATEAINLAIKGVFETFSQKGNHIINVKTEHKAVLDTCQHLEKLGADLTYLEVDAEGNISLENLEKAIKKETILFPLSIIDKELLPVLNSWILILSLNSSILFFLLP
jgi:cysteine desulfurase